VPNRAGQIEKQIARRTGRAGIAGEECALVAGGLGNLLVVAEEVGGLARLVRRTVGSREGLPRSLVNKVALAPSKGSWIVMGFAKVGDEVGLGGPH